MAQAKFSRDKRRLPRMAIGSRREPNRFLVMMAHDPYFVDQKTTLRVTAAGRKTLGMAFIGTHGPWVVVLHRDNQDDNQPSYAVLRLVPVNRYWGRTPLYDMTEAVRNETKNIVRDWNDGPMPPKDQSMVMLENWWSGRERP